MKKFWQIVGRAYLFFKHYKSIVTPLLIAIIIIIQFVFLIAINYKINCLRQETNDFKETALKMINSTYSQVWLLNNRVNQIIEKNK